MTFFAIPTLAGQTAIAAAIAGTAPLTLTTMVIGDGAGFAVTPIQTQINLVNQVYSLALNSVTRTGNQIAATSIISNTVGGWTVREAGLLDSFGNLLFVANVPDTLKETLAMGVDDTLSLTLTVAVSATAQVTLTFSGQTWIDIADPLRPYFMAVNSATTASPPTTPAIGDTYLVPSGATGLWAGQTGLLAQWIPSRLGAPPQWVFAACPERMTIGVGDTDDIMTKIGGVWRSGFASIPEHLAGASTTLEANPAGVAAMISARSDTGSALAFQIGWIQ